MRFPAIFFALGAAVLAFPAGAQDLRVSSETETQLTADEVAALELALDRGLALYRYDQAAWHTTDVMLEDVPPTELAKIRGWVIEEAPGGGGLIVTFFKPVGEAYAGVYRARFSGEAVRDRAVLNGAEAVLNAAQLAQIEARMGPDGSTLGRCADAPFNLVILPPEDSGGPHLVYFLTPQLSTASIPLGGHYRYSVDAGAVVDERAFMNSCFEMPLAMPVDAPGGEAAGMGISHVLDPVPTEIHVFSSLVAGQPLYVITDQNRRLWLAEPVDGAPQLRLVQDDIDRP